jgi:hypothetical protein
LQTKEKEESKLNSEIEEIQKFLQQRPDLENDYLNLQDEMM